jgi:hypothetical protein
VKVRLTVLHVAHRDRDADHADNRAKSWQLAQASAEIFSAHLIGPRSRAARSGDADCRARIQAFREFFGRLADPQDYEGTGKAQHQDAGGCDGDEIY